jgi:type VI secretion system protein ImpJ
MLHCSQYMRSLSRVVWSEGMYLGPHHFQVQARYFEDASRFAIASLWPFSYGIGGCRLDADALENGTVSVLHARGIFPDGLVFDMPDSDALPAVRNLADLFPPTRDTVTVLLGVPERKAGGRNCATSPTENQSARFVAATRPVRDENNGVDERSVEFGAKNFRVLLDIEPADGFATLPLARIMRDGSGRFVFDPSFVPPLLHIAASESLMISLRRLIEILDEKSAAMSRKPGGTQLAEFASRDIASFWFLHAVNSALAPLRHLWAAKRGHPEELYREMARLAGALCTFALDSHPRDIVAYDHDHLDRTFSALDEYIRRHLEIIVPTNCVTIPLAPAAKYFYEGDIQDQRCLNRSRWILGIRSSAGEVEVITKTPQLVKFCSAAFVPELVRRALPGLALTHLPTPPPAVPAKVDYQYFSISKGGPCWEHILKTRRAGVYVPGELPECETELLVILEA